MTLEPANDNTVDPADICRYAVLEREPCPEELDAVITGFGDGAAHFENCVWHLLGAQYAFNQASDGMQRERTRTDLLQAEGLVSNAVELARPFLQRQSKIIKRPTAPALDSDDSDADNCDHFFELISRGLREFDNNKLRDFVVYSGFNSQERRHIHALAHFMHFGHISIGRRNGRILLISRNKDQLPASFKYNIRRWWEQSDWYSNLAPPSEYFSCNNDEHSEDRWTPPTSYDHSGHRAQRDVARGGYSSSASIDSAASSRASNSGRKRRRQDKKEGGFFCFHTGCFEVFDRQCDLNHHERMHLAYEDRPYPCEQCEKRFLFPKDLRRHEKTRHGFEQIPELDIDLIPEFP